MRIHPTAPGNLLETAVNQPKEKITVLLVNGGKHEPIAMLANDDSVRLLVLTEARYQHLYAAETELILIPDIADLSAALAAVRRQLNERSLDFIVAPTERSQPVAGYLRSYFGLPGIPFEVAHRFSHKYAMKTHLAAADIPVTGHRLAPNVAALPRLSQDMCWPVVVKPVIGAGSARTHKISDPQELSRFMDSEDAGKLNASGHAVIIEEYVTMEGEYHCNGLVIDGRIEFAATARYVTPLLGNLNCITGSISLSSDGPDNAAILDLHEKTVGALGLRDGVTHLELFKTRTGFIVGEIACRPGGGEIPGHLRHLAGVDIEHEFLKVSIGRGRPISFTAPDGIVVSVALPRVPGIVKHVTAAERYLAVPGVVEAMVNVKPGDIVPDEIHSSAHSGLVFARTADEESAARCLADITELFQLITE